MQDTPAIPSRRSFLGWLGVTGALALYRPVPEGAYAAKAAPTPTPPRTVSPFIIRNESEKPYVVHYTRLDLNSPIDPPKPDAHRSYAILLPGEELTISAVEMQT